MLETLALAIGRQVATHATRAWLGHRKNTAERTASLTDLLATGVTDQFARRKLERQLEDIGDQVAKRITPLAREFPDLRDNERQAALDAVVDALTEADLTDALMLGADMDGAKLARSVRQRISLNAGLNESAQALYNRVLDETCVSLVSVVQHLPVFQPRALTEILGRLTHIETVLTQLPRTSLDSPGEFTDRYMAFISSTLDSLELFGVDLRRHKPQISVTVAYLSLSVSTPAETRTDDLRVEHALAGSPRTLLRGLAGSGKTTLLQWIAVNAARGSFTGPLAPWNGCIPFLVRLRSYPDGNLPQPEDLVAANAGPLAGQAPDGWAGRQFQSGKALLLVDGVDELRAERRPKVRKWLSELLTAFPSIQVVVTSRPSAAEPHWLKGFRSLLLEPMTPSDVAAFCRRWHSAIRDTVPDLDEYETALARHLEGRRQLRTLASSPLLCALLCALNLDRRKQLPLDRMKLYEASLELLLERRDAERELPVVQELRLDTKSKVTILQHLAWWLTLNGRAEARLDEAVTQVEMAIRRMPDVETDAEQTLRYLLDRSGVIRDPVDGRIDFVHRTFQEYLAGKQAAEEHHMDFLAEKAHSDQWWETVVMGAGHAAVPLRTSLLNQVLNRAEREPRHARRLKLVAACCLDTAHTMAPEVIERVEKAIEDLIPPKRKAEARLLSQGGERVLRHLPRSLEGLTKAQAIACVRTAALIGGPEALKLLTEYAATPIDDVQSELAEVWRYFPAEQYAKEVLADAPLDNGEIYVDRLDHVPQVKHLKNLRRTAVDMALDGKINTLDFLTGVPCLHRLRVNVQGGCTLDLAPLAEHPQLVELYLFGEGQPTNLMTLDGLKSLERLFLSLPPGASDLNFLRSIRSLQELDLFDCGDVRDYSAVRKLDKLTELCMGKSQRLSSLPQMDSVTKLALSETQMSEVAVAITRFPRLTTLVLNECPRDSQISLIAPNLTVLEVRDDSRVDLTAFTQLNRLEVLDIAGHAVGDLSPVSTLHSIRKIRIYSEREVDLNSFAGHPVPLKISVTAGVTMTGTENLGRNVTIEQLPSLF